MGCNREHERRRALARHGEALVSEHLRRAGYQLLARNLRLGRDELDIVARRGETLVICEVRCRANATWIHPAQTLTPGKQRALRRGVATLLRCNPELRGLAVRIDFAAVVGSDASAAITYFEGAL